MLYGGVFSLARGGGATSESVLGCGELRHEANVVTFFSSTRQIEKGSWLLFKGRQFLIQRGSLKISFGHMAQSLVETEKNVVADGRC